MVLIYFSRMQYKTTLFCVCVVVVLFSLLHPSVADNGGGGGRAPILVDDQPPLLPGIPLPDEGHDHHCGTFSHIFWASIVDIDSNSR